MNNLRNCHLRRFNSPPSFDRLKLNVEWLYFLYMIFGGNDLIDGKIKISIYSSRESVINRLFIVSMVGEL